MPKDIQFLANDLIKSLEQELTKTLKTTGEILKSEIKREVINLIDQSPYTPKVYVRTHKLEKSITKSKVDLGVNGVSIDVYSDDDVARSHHMYDKKQPLEAYGEIVETGTGYDYGFPFSGVPRRFVGNVIDRESDSIMNLISKAVGDAIRKL